MINFLKKQKIEFYIFLAILILGALLRFYNYPFRYSLGEETIRDAVIGIEGARQLQFPLTGSFSSLGPFTFGPWYAYQLIIFHLIFPFAYSPWTYLSIISVIYIFIMYKVGRILGGEKLGLVLSLLVAISPAQIISATHLTSHNNTNLFAALAIWIFLILVSKNKSGWWNFLLGFVIGIGMNLHFQMGGLLALPLALFFYKKNYRKFIFSAFGVVCSFIPMLIFEMNNHWFTTRNILDYLMHGKNAAYVPNRWLFYIRDFWPSFWSDAFGVPVWFGNIIIVTFIGLMAWLVYKKKLSKNLLLLIAVFLLNFILLRYYWGQKFFGYLNFLRPFVFIFTAFAIINLKYKKIYIGLLAIFFIVYFSFPRVLSELKPDPFTKKIYEKVDNLEQNYPNKKFALYTCAKEYEPSYNALTFAMLFVLEKRNKFDENGYNLGLVRDCINPKTKDVEREVSGTIDFSKLSKSAILEAGWQPLSFSQIYDSYARWWFKMQP